MSTFTAHDVARYLSSLPRTTASPVELTIAGKVYIGAYVARTFDHRPGTRAYDEASRGERPMAYESAGFYMLGELPASYSRRAVYVADGEARYYVAGWWQGKDGDPYAHLHRFGAWFRVDRDEHGVTLQGPRGGRRIERRISIAHLPQLRQDRVVTVPATYVDTDDATLVLESPDGETGSIELIVAGKVIARGEGFGAAQRGPNLFEMTDARLVGMFGAFLDHALTSSEDGARDGWPILTDDASDWTDALTMMEMEEGMI